MPKISIIITSYKEEKTISRAIKQILKNKLRNYEILVVAPDKETLEIAKQFKNKKIMAIKDLGKGKSAALNLAVKKAKGEILILTDGDVFVDDKALKYLLESLKDSETGAVSGNPISLNSKKNMLGFWAYVLTKIANQRRIKARKLKKRFFCSGYLFAIRKNLFPKLPENLLSEDGFISHNVYESNHKIAYSPGSKIYIKYPTNFKDWIKQKRRSAGGYNQIKKLINVEIRSFKTESFGGLGLFQFVENPKELIFLFALFFARLYLWFLIYKDINIKKKSHKELWMRIESTK